MDYLRAFLKGTIMADDIVYVAMSGGVDSSVAAALLVEEGYNCAGITLKTFCYNENPGAAQSCCSLSTFLDASKVCRKLGISHQVLDVSDFFRDKIITNFVNEYLSGRTPNPCVDCNLFVKFEYLLEKVATTDGTKIATGHYAKIEKNGRRCELRRGVDRAKDQSYFLWRLSQRQLNRALFPVGKLSKEETRRLARDLDLPVADKSESQEICFVPDKDYAGFVKQQVGDKVQPGPIYNLDGEMLGRHKGVAYYTIGQRRGLGLSMNKPVYVAQIDAARNAIIIAENDDLFATSLAADRVNWVSIERPDKPMSVQAQIRYRHPPRPGRLFPLPAGRVEFRFDQPQRAITPGQSVVFYDRDLLLGGGIIDKVF